MNDYVPRFSGSGPPFQEIPQASVTPSARPGHYQDARYYELSMGRIPELALGRTCPTWAQVHVLLDPDPDLNPLVYVVGVLDGGCGDTWEEQCQNRYNIRKVT